ncbi:MAG: YigZ family protein [Bacteroidales bacterium]|nr:YigZ family protein [Bacteroidales bacterium]
MLNDTYKTIEGTSEGLYKEKGSKFLAFAHSVDNIEVVKALLEDYRKRYHDARHVCYAYSLGPEREETKAGDDGEPNGTAGRPILGQILSFELTNVLVVVVRYFGGILLGTGGLVVAYKSAAADALSQAVVVEKTVDVPFTVHVEYPYLDTTLRLLRKWEASILEQTFELDCLLKVAVRKQSVEPLREALEKVETLHLEA